MIPGLLFLLCAATAGAQVPSKDARLDVAKGTKFEYPMPRFASKAEWEQRRDQLRKQILATAGLLPMPARSTPRALISGKLTRDGYSIEKVAVETMPGYYLGGNLYRPLGKSGRFPGIVSPHGHWKNGRLEDSAVGSIPARCINLARQGYVVFAYDMVGYNDTKQTPHAFGSETEDLYNFSPLPLQLWNSLRAVDFIESLPDVDSRRLGATGASGGGTQTFLLAAVDPRIRVDVPVNMISGIMQGGSPCENAPGLRHDVFNVEFGAMMAPRPMLMVAATGDWTKNTPQNEFPTIRSVYSLYDAAPQVESVQFNSPHNYHQGSREAMYAFFAKHFLGKSDSVAEQPYAKESDADMLVWAGRTMPEGALDYAGVFGKWKSITAVNVPDREILRVALSVEIPAQVTADIKASDVALTRNGHGDRVTGIYQQGSGAPMIVVHPDGADKAMSEAKVQGRPVLYLNAWRGGRDTSAKYFTTFHRTDAQNRVQDILTAAAWLRTKHNGNVELRGLNAAAVWTTFAAAVDAKLRLTATATNFQGTDEDFVRGFFVPGIQRVGGWKAARALAQR